MSASVVRTRDGAKSLMTGSVPDLQFYLISIKQEWFEPEVNSDSCEENFAEFIVSVSHDDRWLADGGVANEDYLEEVVVLSLALHTGAKLIINKSSDHQYISLTFQLLQWRDFSGCGLEVLELGSKEKELGWELWVGMIFRECFWFLRKGKTSKESSSNIVFNLRVLIS